MACHVQVNRVTLKYLLLAGMSIAIAEKDAIGLAILVASSSLYISVT